MKKRAFLYAYDFKNLGDDLFIKSIITRYPNVCFYMLVDKKEKEYLSQFNNIKVLDSESLILKKISRIIPSVFSRYRDFIENRCEAIIYIGGSIFIEYDNWKNISNWWDYEADKNKFYVIGANFGPYKNEAYRQRMSDIFLKMKDVCFRDRYSKSLFDDNVNVRYAPDILLGFPIPKVNKKEKQAFFSIINCIDKDEGSNQLGQFDHLYVRQMASIINELIRDDWTVILSSFCKREGDEKGIEKIIAKLDSDKNVKVINYDGYNYHEILSSMAESECVFATRFHATIFALSAKVPVFPVVYSNKTINVLSDIGFKGECIDIRNLREDNNISVHDLLQYSRNQLIENIDFYVKESENHFKKLDLILK